MLTTTVALAAKYDYLAPKFQKAYEFLRRADLAQLAPGDHPIDGDEVYANVQHYTTVPASEAKFESHDRYFDIQYMVEGCERFGYIPREELAPAPYMADRDLTFYDQDPQDKASYVLLRAGDCAIVPPEDAHKPRCAAGEPMAVKKIVVKVKV